MRLEDLPTNDEWNEYDWKQIFRASSEDEWPSTEYSGTYSVHDRSQVDDITAERIANVERWFGYSPEGGGSLDFAALVELSDGTWGSCMAWADYTGWGCQCGVEWKWSRTRDDAITQGLDRAARERLGVPLPGEAVA